MTNDGFWWEEKEDNPDDEPTLSLKELELRKRVLENALRILKHRDVSGNNTHQPITTQVFQLERDVLGDFGSIVYYLVKEGTITEEYAKTVQGYPNSGKIDELMKYFASEDTSP